MRRLISIVLLCLIGTEANSQTALSERDFRNAQAYAVGVNVAYTVAESLINLEAEADRGFFILKVCINPGLATTAAFTNWALFRTTTASSGGTVITTESSTTVAYLNRLNQRNAIWSGAARTAGTEGASGPLIDTASIYVSTATTQNIETCHTYCTYGTQCPYIPKGITNGVKLMFTGTAGGAGQSARIEFIATE